MMRLCELRSNAAKRTAPSPPSWACTRRRFTAAHDDWGIAGIGG